MAIENHRGFSQQTSITSMASEILQVSPDFSMHQGTQRAAPRVWPRAGPPHWPAACQGLAGAPWPERRCSPGTANQGRNGLKLMKSELINLNGKIIYLGVSNFGHT